MKKSFKKKGLFIIIPVYNEGPVIEQVLKDVQKIIDCKIIVVDDGSTDQTHSLLENKKIILLRHFINRGKGAAVSTGINAALKLGAEYAITMDGDGQHDPKDVENIMNKLKKGFDVVLGYRKFSSKDIPLVKKMHNSFANVLIFFLYNIWVKDSQSGFRGYSKKALLFLDANTDRYEFDSKVLRDVKKNNLKFAEIPVKVYYTDYSRNKNNKQTFLNGIRTLYKILISL